MKILFLTASFKTPSVRFRVLQNLAIWRDLGLEVEVVRLPKGNWDRFKLLRKLPLYDIVVLQKRLLHRHSLYLLRQRARTLVFDFDDAVMFSDSNGNEFISERKSLRFAAIAHAADLLCAGNEYLQEQAIEAGAHRVEVVPTGVDCDYFTPDPSCLDDSIIRPLTIGWIGSRANLVYLKALAEPLNSLFAERQDFKLAIVCDDFIDDFNCPVEKIRWSKEREVDNIRGFDIGVMPLFEDPWSKGKCAFKLLQYMACGLPTVASATAVTRKIVKSEKSGLLASDPEEMVAQIAWFLDQRQELPAIGKRARQALMGTYDSQTVARQYASLFALLAD